MQVRTLNRGGSTPETLELRASEFGITDPTALRLIAQGIGSAVPVTNDRVFGLPTIVQCIRLAAVNIAQLTPIVYDEAKGYENREIAKTAWQYKLFKQPSLDSNRFNMFADLSAGIDGFGNSFAQKIRGVTRKDKNQIVDLRVIPPDCVKVYRNKDTGEKNFDVKLAPRDIRKGLTASDILHFRGFNFGGGLSGMSLIQQYKYSLGNIIAMQEFTGRYWINDGKPGGYISLPEESSDMDKTALDEILDMWMERHAGVGNSQKPGILKGGAKYETLPIDATSAQLIEGNKYSVEEMARMMDFPVELLQPGGSDYGKIEELLLRFITLYLSPRVERIRATINEDPDLFDGPMSDICLDFDWARLHAANTIEQANADMRMRQGGILTANEIRARRGYPPHKDGDELSPVVGAGTNNGGNQTGPSGADSGK